MMKYIAVLIPLLLATVAIADPPWSANVRAADVGDSINEGESCIASDGDYIYCVCNWAERATRTGLTYGRSTDGGATWTSGVWKDTSVGINWHSDPFILVDDSHYYGEQKVLDTWSRRRVLDMFFLEVVADHLRSPLGTAQV
jgi:hypothetical protein